MEPEAACSLHSTPESDGARRWEPMPPTPESGTHADARLAGTQYATPTTDLGDASQTMLPRGVCFTTSAPTPRAGRGTKFVSLAEASSNALGRRRPSMLSRSGTLSSLLDMARVGAQEKNNFKGFNHHSWFTTIQWIFKGSGMNVFIPLTVLFVWSAAVVVTVETMGLQSRVDLQSDATSALAGCTSLLLAFRLNVCYSRWWEGRLLWGRVIASARSMVTMALSLQADCTPHSDEALARRAIAEGLAGWSIAFAVALKYHLRESKLDDSAAQLQSISRLLKGGLGSRSPRVRVSDGVVAYGTTAIGRLKLSEHPPLHALRSIRHAIRRLVGQTRAAGMDSVALENSLNGLSDDMHQALTGCERILRTPCPPGYVGVLRLSLLFFLTLLPFLLLEVGYCAILIALCTSFVLLGAEEVAIQLEQPFGDDQNDLPLDSYCFTLEADLMSLLDEKIEDDLSTDAADDL